MYYQTIGRKTIIMKTRLIVPVSGTENSRPGFLFKKSYGVNQWQLSERVEKQKR
jgi:hypothetical protein